MFEGWVIEDFMAVQTTVAVRTKGWTKQGVGLYRNALGFWWLIHLNTGHGIVRLGVEDLDGLAHEPRMDVMVWADAIVDAADWTFSDVGGWKNRTPDLPQKLQEIVDQAPFNMITTPTAANGRRNGRAARQVAISRMDA